MNGYSTPLEPSNRLTVLSGVVFLLMAAAFAVFAPLCMPLVLAAWVSVLARPLLAKTERVTGGRRGAAAALVAAFVIVVLVPIGASLFSLSGAAVELFRELSKSGGAKSALLAVVSDSAPASGGLSSLTSPRQVVSMIRSYGEQAFQIVSGIAEATSGAVLGIFIFVYSVYVFLVDGPALYKWAEKYSPLAEGHMLRLAGAFNETGRGLLVGVGLTGLAQGSIATVTYFALGVPRALVLGLITCLASLIPSVGTALVWIPVAIGLAFAGKSVAATVLAVVGIVVIGAVDNFIRPFLSRVGKLDLSSFALLTSMFGGLALFGASGLLFGPLLARLAKEALILSRDERAGGVPVPLLGLGIPGESDSAHVG